MSLSARGLHTPRGFHAGSSPRHHPTDLALHRKDDKSDDEASDSFSLGEQEDQNRLRKATYKDDGKFLLTFALPLCYSNAAWVLMNVISMGFISKINNGAMLLSAQGVAMIWMGFCQQLLSVPLSVAVESLAAGAFGAEKRDIAGIWLHISLAVATGLSIIVAASWGWVGFLMQAFNLLDSGDEQYLPLVNTYARWSILGIVPDVYYIVISTWYQSDEVLAPSIFAPTVSLGASCVLNYVFIYVMDMGFKGAPLATAISSWVQLIVFMLWVTFVNKQYNKYVYNFNFSRITPRRLKVFVWGQLLPQMASTVLDEGHNLIISVLATLLGNLQIAAHNFALNVLITFFAIPGSLMVAIGVRVGNYLGANLPTKARRMTFLGIGASLVIGVVLALGMFFLRHKMVFVVETPGEEGPSDQVVQYAMQIFPWLCATVASYAAMSAVLGALDGMARAKTVAAILTIGAWGVSVPLAFLMKVLNMGLEGLWFAEAVGYAVTCACGFVILSTTDWRKEAKEAAERNDDEDEDLDAIMGDEEDEDEDGQVARPINSDGKDKSSKMGSSPKYGTV